MINTEKDLPKARPKQMNKLQLGVIGLLIICALCLMAGIALGLWLGWSAWPVQIANVDATDLKPSAQDELIVMTADAYAFDNDLDRARERLDELKDPNIVNRVSDLAKQYAANNDPTAASLAALAAALGASENKVAQVVKTTVATATLIQATAEISPSTLTPIATTTIQSSPTFTPTRTLTPRPRATATTKPPTAVPIAATEWLPDRTGWPGGVGFQPVNVAPGLKYWHLIRAVFCDIDDTRFDCANRPGGTRGIGVYIKLLSGTAPLLKNDKPANLEEKTANDPCDCTYEDYPDGTTLAIGNYPSDKINGLALSSIRSGYPNTHVRYFLYFQVVTR